MFLTNDDVCERSCSRISAPTLSQLKACCCNLIIAVVVAIDGGGGGDATPTDTLLGRLEAESVNLGATAEGSARGGWTEDAVLVELNIDVGMIFDHNVFRFNTFALLLNTPACCCSSSREITRRTIWVDTNTTIAYIQFI